jgi:hypothetical protein
MVNIHTSYLGRLQLLYWRLDMIRLPNFRELGHHSVAPGYQMHRSGDNFIDKHTHEAHIY